MKYVRCDSHCKYPAYTQDEVYTKNEIDNKFRKLGVFRLEKHTNEQELTTGTGNIYTRINFETSLGTTNAPFEMVTKTDENNKTYTGVKIKSGVSKVVVSGNAYVSNSGSTKNSYNLYIRVEDETGTKKEAPNNVCSRVESVPASVGTSVSCSSYLLEVEENDVIFMELYRDNSTESSEIPAISPVRTYLSVEVAE